MEEEKQQSTFHTCENMIYKSTISTGLLSTIYTIFGPKKLSTIYNILGLTVYNLQANFGPNLQST